jgi:homoserine/homoserine lactone efflux protein
MLSLNTWLNFALVALVVTLIPGPAFIMVLSSSLRRGFKGGAYATMGIVIGDGVYFALTAIGLGSILATSFWTFTVIKWLGIAYLAYLGLRSLFFPTDSLVDSNGRCVSGRRALTTALTVQLANPKLLLFLAALVPQFVDTTQPLAPQFAILGGTFIASDTFIYLLLAMFASRARGFLANRRAARITSRVCGAGMLGAAVRIATE